MRVMRSPEPYFPAGKLQSTNNHSYLSRFLMSLVLVFILFCFVLGILLIPFRCWGKAWLSVLANPYSFYSTAVSSDDIKSKQKLTKIKKFIESFPFVSETYRVKNFCSGLVLFFFLLTAYIILGSNFGRHAQCGVVSSLNKFFDDKSTGFVKYFGMNKNSILSHFKDELYEFKPGDAFLKRIIEFGFGHDSRILQNDLDNFVTRFQGKTIASCDGSNSSYNPYEQFFMHSKELTNMNVKQELEELIQFGTEIEYSAWNLLNHKREQKKFTKKSKKEKNSGTGSAGTPEEYKGSIDLFSESIQNVNQQLNVVRFTILNGFEGLLMDFTKAVNRKREALFLMVLSAGIYVLGFFLKKKFVRVQLLVWLLSAGFLMWFGFRFHNRAIR